MDGNWVRPSVELGATGVHASLLPDGSVLFFAYDENDEDNLNRSFWQLWDPATESPMPLATHGRNLFCSGHCFLPDGRLLVAAGQSRNFVGTIEPSDHDLHTFDPVTRSWTRHENMKLSRWYPTCVELPDGSVFICGGAANRGPYANNDEYEIFAGDDNRLSPARKLDSEHWMGTYPFLQLLPNGSPEGVIFIHSGRETRLFNVARGTWSTARGFVTASPFIRTYPHQGSCVLLPLEVDAEGHVGSVRVLVMGGQGGDQAGHHGLDTPATNTAEIFDFQPNEPQTSGWRMPFGGAMSSPRFMGESVLLPDGTVLLVNGAAIGSADHSRDPVREAELFDPATESWRVLQPTFSQPLSEPNPRMYHSTALLLADGRVLIAGNTEHWNPGNEIEDKTVELYSPAYLALQPRPTLTADPAPMAYHQEHFLAADGASEVAFVSLLRPSSTTHTNNMSQRMIKLAVLDRTTDGVMVRTPPNPVVAPPGDYLVFLVGTNGAVSGGRFVRVEPTGPAGWGSRGGVLSLAPTATTNADGRIEVFQPAPGGQVMHIFQTAPSNGWAGWQRLQGESRRDVRLQGRVAAVRNDDGRLEVFARGEDDALWHAWQQAPGADWHRWVRLGEAGECLSDPAAAVNNNGRLEVVARWRDGSVRRMYQQVAGTAWSGWHSFPDGADVAGSPVIARNADARLEVVVRRLDGSVHSASQATPSGGWTPWLRIGNGLLNSDLAVASRAGTLVVFGRGLDGSLWHLAQSSPGVWTGPDWGSIGGDLAPGSRPTVITSGAGELQLFVRWFDDSVRWSSQITGTVDWTPWQNLGAPVGSDPAASMNADGRLEVFALGTDRSLVHRWQPW